MAAPSAPYAAIETMIIAETSPASGPAPTAKVWLNTTYSTSGIPTANTTKAKFFTVSQVLCTA